MDSKRAITYVEESDYPLTLQVTRAVVLIIGCQSIDIDDTHHTPTFRLTIIRYSHSINLPIHLTAPGTLRNAMCWCWCCINSNVVVVVHV